ncbi:response regulator [Ramlibacter sp. USB13]|uniref:Response regulator n=1 Tax=Ramlibacter cellulosilyticus TaxID=2764187 RepID=A0A923SGC5_9BURK|nr:response regulator [Ramlibacter cellulosilyticus]MBC5784797.1 response regulator [Ramlibacter cellulosilyticus]
MDPSAAAQPLPSPLVLVADDEPDCADNLAELLRFVGYRVLVAYDGDTAVLASLQHCPDAVVLDLHMPRMGGLAACSRIRQQCSRGPVTLIALTASGEAGHREAAELAGFDHYLVKPLMVGALLNVLPPVPYEPLRHS